MSTHLRLRSVQQNFQSYLMTGAPVIDAIAVSDDIANAQTRLAIYFDAYRLRLVEVLGNDYSALKIVMGDSPFEKMAHAYLDAYPSGTRSIRWFGRHLPEFLRSAMPYAHQPLFADLAFFEWRRGEVFDERDAPSVMQAQIAVVPPEHWPGLRFELIPAHRRLQLEWNAPAICKAVESNTQSPQIERVPSRWLLWRQGLDTYWRSLDDTEAAALDAVSAGASFAEICEGLLPWVKTDEAALRAASLLKRWIVDGLISQLRITNADE